MNKVQLANVLITVVVAAIVIANVLPQHYKTEVRCPTSSTRFTVSGYKFGLPFSFFKTRSTTYDGCVVDGSANLNHAIFIFQAFLADLVCAVVVFGVAHIGREKWIGARA